MSTVTPFPSRRLAHVNLRRELESKSADPRFQQSLGSFHRHSETLAFWLGLAAGLVLGAYIGVWLTVWLA